LNARFVVPSERHVERLASGPVAFETLPTLQSRLLASLVPHLVVADPEVCRMALVQALLEAARHGSFLAKAADGGALAWQRTVDAIDDALTVVRQTGCATALATVLQQEGDERARVLTLALAAQDEKLAKLGSFDGRSTNDVLVRAIRATDPATVAIAVGAPTLVARYFVAWEPGQLALWRALDSALSARGGRAMIELPTFDVALDASRLGSALDQLSDEVAAALDDAPVTVAIEARLGDFRFLGPPPADVRARVELKQAPDAAVQAWAAAEVVHAAIVRGVAPERIAILVPDRAEEVLGPICGALAEAGIVTHDPRGPAAGTSPVVRFGIRALEVADDGLPRQKLATLLRSQYADARALSGLGEEAEAREVLRRVALALESSPPVRSDDPVRAVELTVARAAARRGTAGARLLPQVAAHAAGLLRRGVGGRTRAEHASRARALFAALGLPGAATRGASDLLAGSRPSTELGRVELRAFARDASAWDALTTALEAHEHATLRLGMANDAASNAVFREELLNILARTVPRPASGRAGAVRLVRAPEVAAEPLDVLVVADFNEGAFPARSTLPAFYSPALESRLRELDARFPTSASRGARDLAELALAVSAAERIILIHRARDDAGGILAPAPVFVWLEQGGVAVENCRAKAVREKPLTVDQAQLRELLLRPGAADTLAPSAAHRARVERTREAFFSGGAAADAPMVGALAPDAVIHRLLVDETGGEDVPMAVTALERFAACPFQGYATQVLGARDLRASGDAPDAREQGSIVHGALAAAFKATARLWPLRPRDGGAIRGEALAAADAFLEREASSSGLRRLALDEARRDVLRVVEWSLADEQWDFAAAEQSFGSGRPDSWDAVRIERGGARLALRGAIDRLDVGHGRSAVRAIDYKLGDGAAQRAARGLGELTFQLPVYARAGKVKYAASRTDGLYLPMRVRGPLPPLPPKGHAEVWDRAMLEDNGRAAFEDRAMGIVEQVRAGSLLPTPRQEHACDTCSLDGGCRKPRFAIEAEREDEPEAR
jgi:hypothetical protein